MVHAISPNGTQIHPEIGGSSLGGEGFALSDMIDPVGLLREFNAPFGDLSLGMVGLGSCGSLYARPKNKRAITEKYVARHFPGDQQALGAGELHSVYWSRNWRIRR